MTPEHLALTLIASVIAFTAGSSVIAFFAGRLVGRRSAPPPRTTTPTRPDAPAESISLPDGIPLSPEQRIFPFQGEYPPDWDELRKRVYRRRQSHLPELPRYSDPRQRASRRARPIRRPAPPKQSHNPLRSLSRAGRRLRIVTTTPTMENGPAGVRS